MTTRPPHHMFWRLASWMSTRVRCFKSKSELSGASLSSADINKEMETWLISTACVGALKISAESSVFGALTPSLLVMKQCPERHVWLRFDLICPGSFLNPATIDTLSCEFKLSRTRPPRNAPPSLAVTYRRGCQAVRPSALGLDFPPHWWHSRPDSQRVVVVGG